VKVPARVVEALGSDGPLHAAALWMNWWNSGAYAHSMLLFNDFEHSL